MPNDEGGAEGAPATQAARGGLPLELLTEVLIHLAPSPPRLLELGAASSVRPDILALAARQPRLWHDFDDCNGEQASDGSTAAARFVARMRNKPQIVRDQILFTYCYDGTSPHGDGSLKRDAWTWTRYPDGSRTLGCVYGGHEKPGLHSVFSRGPRWPNAPTLFLEEFPNLLGQHASVGDGRLPSVELAQDFDYFRAMVTRDCRDQRKLRDPTARAFDFFYRLRSIWLDDPASMRVAMTRCRNACLFASARLLADENFVRTSIRARPCCFSEDVPFPVHRLSPQLSANDEILRQILRLRPQSYANLPAANQADAQLFLVALESLAAKPRLALFAGNGVASEALYANLSEADLARENLPSLFETDHFHPPSYVPAGLLNDEATADTAVSIWPPTYMWLSERLRARRDYATMFVEYARNQSSAARSHVYHLGYLAPVLRADASLMKRWVSDFEDFAYLHPALRADQSLRVALWTDLVGWQDQEDQPFYSTLFERAWRTLGESYNLDED